MTGDTQLFWWLWLDLFEVTCDNLALKLRGWKQPLRRELKMFLSLWSTQRYDIQTCSAEVYFSENRPDRVRACVGLYFIDATHQQTVLNDLD